MTDEHPIDRLKKKKGMKIEEEGILPDGSGRARGSMPLPKDHWIYGNPEYIGEYEPPPMPLKLGTSDARREWFVKALWEAGQYAVRAVTMKGLEDDFDPDALLQSLVVGMLGYFTEDGLDHTDDWANPKQYQKKGGRNG